MKRPTIVCLCGSTRFYEAFQEANYKETLAGKIVLSVGWYMHRSKEMHAAHEASMTPAIKKRLDELHLAKIDLADEVLCLNIGDYMGDSTKREVWYALRMDKKVRLWETPSRWDFASLRTLFIDMEAWQNAADAAAAMPAPQPMAGTLHARKDTPQ